MKHHEEVARNDRHLCELARGSASSCLVLVPDELRSTDQLLHALDLHGATVVRLEAGELRPAFEPHPTSFELLREARWTHIVLVTLTSARRFGRASCRRLATGFLEQQLMTLLDYRKRPELTALADVRVHGWVWDTARGRLYPFDWMERDLDRAQAVDCVFDSEGAWRSGRAAARPATSVPAG